MTMKLRRTTILVVILTLLGPGLSLPTSADEAPAKSKKTGDGAPGGLLEPLASLNDPDLQEDFATLCVDSGGSPWVAYVEYNGTADTLRMARWTGQGFAKLGPVSRPGNVYQPCLACDGEGNVWCVWSQMEDGGEWNLYARAVTGGKLEGTTVTVADSAGNDVFPDARVDRRGRVWVAWQSFRGSNCDIFTRHHDPKTGAWSAPIRVTSHAAGDWEPRLAFTERDEALIVFDTYRNGNFDVYLARVSPAGKVKLSPVATSSRYEARAEAAASPDGKTLWVAYEDGVSRWGKDLGSEWRKLGGGLHFDRHLYLARVDLSTGESRNVADVTPLIPGLLATLGQPTSGSICLPELIVDRQGDPWLFFRFGSSFWQVAVTKYDADEDRWTRPRQIAGSNYCQDRRIAVVAGADDSIWVACSGDGRKAKDQGDSGVSLSRIDPDPHEIFSDSKVFNTTQERAAPAFTPVNTTPERSRGDLHRWNVGGGEYVLGWGDLHRHTDFSNCRTSDDGCIVEHFRYAYDASGLDYLTTTDHSDQGKGYTDYEWWQTQKLADMFHNPGSFLTLYGYEREQGSPYGHRNVFFSERGGPIIYIKRERFANSTWGKELKLPPQAGARQGEISPPQLWQLLRQAGVPAMSIAHTPAGNDWSLFDEVDDQVETVMEMYQGSRQSYEGGDAPQPRVAKQGVSRTTKTARGRAGKGRYQDALGLGHKLGVIASSDHRSTNISFGGIYLKTFDREGLMEAISARRTIAATDKIVMELSCNGHILGDVFETASKPTLSLSVEGTAPLRQITVIRNEKVVYQITPDGPSSYRGTYEDLDPVIGENRYYLRIEQVDGNMGWTSPVWATYTPKE